MHWSTANVNYKVDEASKNVSYWVIDSKDAKSIIPGDIYPVQQQGKTWKSMELPDHEWDQSRDNAVTPMAHLFMDTKVKETKEEQIGTGSKVIKEYIVRSFQVYTFVNLSLAEPDTAYRRFNGIFRLLTVPALDGRFRNDVNEKLKSNFAFIVDNGPGEQPSSPIVQMLLVRLLFSLNLAKVVVTAFAEYHSKRNFAERVQAAEHDVLSRHGLFNFKQRHSSAPIGSQEHKENMEAMADDVFSCLWLMTSSLV